MPSTDCVFCAIVAGDIPSTRVIETDAVIALRDLAPRAPTHVLVIPRAHFVDVADVALNAPAVVVEMIDVAKRVADQECGGQYRLIFNSGPDAGQSVAHVHGHVIGGRELGWSPA